MASPQPAPADEKSTTEVVSDLFDLLKTYARQETVDPIKSLGRFMGYGTAAALVLGIAGTLLTVGVLRLVQVETRDFLDGNWCWVPYMAALIVERTADGALHQAHQRKPASERS